MVSSSFTLLSRFPSFDILFPRKSLPPGFFFASGYDPIFPDPKLHSNNLFDYSSLYNATAPRRGRWCGVGLVAFSFLLVHLPSSLSSFYNEPTPTTCEQKPPVFPQSYPTHPIHGRRLNGVGKSCREPQQHRKPVQHTTS